MSFNELLATSVALLEIWILYEDCLQYSDNYPRRLCN